MSYGLVLLRAWLHLGGALYWKLHYAGIIIVTPNPSIYVAQHISVYELLQCRFWDSSMMPFTIYFDGKLPFTIYFLGLQLPVTWLSIIGQYPGHWNTLIRQKCGNGDHILHLIPKMAKTGGLKAIFDGKMPFTIYFLGLQLPVTWLPIIGQYSSHWNTLIGQKCGNGDHIFTLAT